MQNLDKIAEDLFNKIRGRFSNVTIGNAEGNITDVPTEARFFDFEYTDNDRPLGKVSVNISEDPSNPEKKSLTVIYSKDFISNEDQVTQTGWFNFLKELRVFGKKRRLNFDIRDINKSNLDKRDYKFLAANRPGEGTMTESKLYGTSRVSYQNVDNARIVIKHTENVNHELAAGRTQNIGVIYIESSEGERFKYPYKHLGGARAMARHVSEGGKPFDDFGKHIVGLSEELSKLRKFKNYMGRSAVMAESLAGYMDAVYERITTVKKTIEGLQRKSYYTEAFESFETPTEIEVPDEIAENWIDQLTIRQFNEELKDVFPYIYRLVSEVTKAKTLGPDELVDEAGKMKGGADDPCWKGYKMVGHKKKGGKEVPNCVPESITEKLAPEQKSRLDDLIDQFRDAVDPEADYAFDGDPPDPEEIIAQIRSEFGDKIADIVDSGAHKMHFPRQGHSRGYDDLAMKSPVSRFTKVGKMYKQDKDFRMNQIRQKLSRKSKEEIELEQGIERLMGQFAEGFSSEGESILAKIAAAGDSGYDMIDDGLNGKFGKEAERLLQDMYNEISVEQRLHPDDDFEKIMDRMMDQIEADYSDSDADTREAKGKDQDNDGDIDSDDYLKARDIAIKKAMGKDTDEKVKEQKTPIGEFILSHYDKETGKFPKGETAVLTMVEKDYGEQFIEPAKAFIERINQTFEQFQMRTQPQQMEVDSEFDRMRELAGLR